MTVKIKDIRSALELDEPDYDEAAKMGSEALPHLEKLVKGDDSELAAKAASLAGIIAAEGSMAVLKIASESHDPIVRVAAAGAARDLSDSEASQVLATLINDADVGVQKTALKSVPENPSSDLRSQLEDISNRGDLPAGISESIHDLVTRLGRGDHPEQNKTFTEMPDIQEEMPGFDAATSIDESVGHSIAEEREMPGEADTEINGEMPSGDTNTSSNYSNEQEMPCFDKPVLSAAANVSGAETLTEMPS